MHGTFGVTDTCSTMCTGAWVPRVRAWLLHTLGCPCLLPGLGALQVLACDQPGCVDAFFVDAVQPCGGKAPVKRCSRAWPRQSLGIGSPGGGTKHGTLPLRMEEGLETTLRRCGDMASCSGAERCSRPSAAGAVPRGQVSGGRTCHCTATLGGAAFGQGELGKLPGFQLKKKKIKGQEEGRAARIPTSLLQIQAGTCWRGLRPTRIPPRACDGGQKQC